MFSVVGACCQETAPGLRAADIVGIHQQSAPGKFINLITQ